MFRLHLRGIAVVSRSLSSACLYLWPANEHTVVCDSSRGSYLIPVCALMQVGLS